MKKFLALTILFALMLNTVVSASAGSARITDISSRPSEQLIRNAYDRGIVHVFADNTVRPGTAMTRGDFAFALERWIINSDTLLRGFNISFASRNVSFRDLDNTQFFYNEVRSLADRGVIQDTIPFRPTSNITREEAARWIENLFGMMRSYNRNAVYFRNMGVVEFLDEFSDGRNVATASRNAMAFMLDRWFIQPDQSGNIRPQNSITREEGFALIMMVEAYLHSYRGTGNWSSGGGWNAPDGNWGWGGNWNHPGGGWGGNWGAHGTHPWSMHNHWNAQNPQAQVQPPMWTGQAWQQPNPSQRVSWEFPSEGWTPWQRPPGWWNEPPWWPGAWNDSSNWQWGWGWNQPNWEDWSPFWPWPMPRDN
ncbi:MAG: S-layer homology domain-containing protein [Defluviitaleaceae bacterium]|nr:S-layer homology domain-containing protein [Defluviitaleaceae bacterium]